MLKNAMVTMMVLGLVGIASADVTYTFDTNIDGWTYDSGPGAVSWQDTYYIDAATIDSGCLRINHGGEGNYAITQVMSQPFDIYEAVSNGNDVRFQIDCAAKGGGWTTWVGMMFKWDDDNYYVMRYLPEISGNGRIDLYGKVNGVEYVDPAHRYPSSSWFRTNMQLWMQFDKTTNSNQMQRLIRDVAGGHTLHSGLNPGFDLQALGQGRLYLMLWEPSDSTAYWGNFDNIIITGANPIPEPATIGLLALGAVGLIRRR